MSDLTTTDVQAELQEYLNSKNINSLFIQIVERLLIEKPDNPVGFMVEYLLKKYPDETRAASMTSARKASIASGTTFHSHVSDEESSEEENDDDYVDDMVAVAPKPGGPSGASRRVSVSAESVNPSQAPQELKVIPKSGAETARIMDILHENIMFKHLDETQAQSVKDAMFLVTKKEGEEIIKQGTAGDNFYVIDEGEIDVFIKKDEKEVKIKSMGPGESFGELALMYSTPRTATCLATTPLRMWALDRISFKVIIMNTTIAKRNQYKNFLQNVRLLDQLTEYERLTIADALIEKSYKEGDVVCEQGDVGDNFYIIKDGHAVCFQTDATGETIEVARLDQGNYFGEIALMHSKVRQATVKSKGDLTVLALDRKTFKRVMGPLDEILKRNMEAYRQIAAQNI